METAAAAAAAAASLQTRHSRDSLRQLRSIQLHRAMRQPLEYPVQAVRAVMKA